jgi:hypothetical protein
MLEKRVLCGIFEPKGDEVTGGWRRYRKNFVFVLFTNHICNNQNKENETGVAYCTHSIIQFWLKSLRGRGHLEHLGTGGRITLK